MGTWVGERREEGEVRLSECIGGESGGKMNTRRE